MPKFYISFGQNHEHKKFGKVFNKDCICEIEAATAEAGMEAAFVSFGNKWAMIYSKKPHMRHFPGGLVRFD